MILPLPFFLSSPVEFYRNVIEWHLTFPFRTDALSLSMFIYQYFSRPIPSWIPFLSLLIAWSFAAFQKTLHRALLFVILGYFLFFFLYRQAFTNYYYFIQCLMILSLVLAPARKEIPEQDTAGQEEVPD
jgi:hypothetical protein